VVIPAAGTGRLRDDLQLARPWAERKHRPAGEVAAELRRLAVRKAGVEVVERHGEPAQVLSSRRRGEVESLGEFLGSLYDAGEAADQDVRDPLTLERGEDRVRVEPRLLGAPGSWGALPRARRNPRTRRWGESSAFLSSRSIPVGSYGTSSSGRSKP